MDVKSFVDAMVKWCEMNWYYSGDGVPESAGFHSFWKQPTRCYRTWSEVDEEVVRQVQKLGLRCFHLKNKKCFYCPLLHTYLA